MRLLGEKGENDRGDIIRNVVSSCFESPDGDEEMRETGECSHWIGICCKGKLIYLMCYHYGNCSCKYP